MGEYKPKMAANIRRIRHVLMHEWDPIGIGSVADWPEDEYDAYLMPVYSILRHRKGEPALLAYLAQAYEQITGVRLAPEEFRGPAQRLLQIDVNQDDTPH
jgi:hypothetical protein